jgi:hypothetical protein
LKKKKRLRTAPHLPASMAVIAKGILSQPGRRGFSTLSVVFAVLVAFLLGRINTYSDAPSTPGSPAGGASRCPEPVHDQQTSNSRVAEGHQQYDRASPASAAQGALQLKVRRKNAAWVCGLAPSGC